MGKKPDNIKKIQEREQQIKKMVEKLREEEMLRHDVDEDGVEDIATSETATLEKMKRPQPAGNCSFYPLIFYLLFIFIFFHLFY